MKAKMIDRDRLLRKMRKTKLETDIAAYIMKRGKVNTCLRKVKSKYYQMYWMKIFDHPRRLYDLLQPPWITRQILESN